MRTRLARKSLVVALGSVALLSSYRIARAVTCGTDTTWCVDNAGGSGAYTTSPLGLAGYGLANVYAGVGTNLVALTEASGGAVFAADDESFGSTITTEVTPIWWNSTPTGTAVYFATTDGNVHGVYATSGTSIWTTNIARSGCNDQVTGPIAVNLTADLLYVATSDDPACTLNQNRVYALNTSNGSVAWTFNGSPYATSVGLIKYGVLPDIFQDTGCTTSPGNTVGGRNQVVFADSAGNVFVLNATTGALLNAGAPKLLTNPGSLFLPQFSGSVCGASYVADNGTLGAGQGTIKSLSIDPGYCGTAANTPCTIPGESYTGPYASPIQFSVARGAGSGAADRFLVNDASGVLNISSTAASAECTYRPASGGSVFGTPFEIGGVAYTETTEGSIVGIPLGASQKTDNSACNGYQERFFSAATTSTGSNPSVDIVGGAYALFAGDQASRMASLTAPFSAGYTVVFGVTGFPSNVGPMTLSDGTDTLTSNGSGVFPMPTALSNAASYTPTASPLTFGGLTCTQTPTGSRSIGAQDGYVSVSCATTGCGFAAAANYPLGASTYPQTVVSADLNADGYLDLVMPENGGGVVAVLLGSASGTFTGPTTTTSMTGPTGVAVADFNEDGKLDVIVVNTVNVDLMLGNGNGTLQAQTSVTATVNYVAGIASGDMNGDGHKDFVLIDDSPSAVHVFLGTGTGTFAETTTSLTGSNPGTLVVADFNADGKPDVATANLNSDNVTVLIGNGAGGFSSQVVSTPASQPLGVATGDFDGNGTIDVAVLLNGNFVQALLNNGTGTLTAQTSIGVGSSPRGIAVGDFDGDGKADVAAASFSSNNVTVLKGTGTGTFTTLSTLGVGSGVGPIWAVAADFNKDGTPDLAVADNQNPTAEISVFLDVGSCCSSATTNTYDCGATCGSVVNCAASEQNARGPSCASGACALAGCESGYGDCDGNHTNGCETSTSANVSHCGACGTNCTTNEQNATGPSCSSSACNYTSCNANFGDCDANRTNGCETNLQTNPNDCSACGTVCSSNNIATPACGGGVCNGACNAGFSDCNANKQTDGCETSTATSFANCGACAHSCTSGQACIDSTCVTEPTGIVAWYPMQGTLNDSLGVGSNGTLFSTPWVTDRFGNPGDALSFSGVVTSYATLVDTNLPSGSSARTMSVWFYSTTASAGSWEPTLNYGQLVSDDRFGLLVGNSQNEYFVGQGNDVQGNLTWGLSAWHNLVVTYAGGAGLVQMYLDGAPTANTTLTLATTAQSVTYPMVLGQSVTNGNNDGHYNGVLSDFRMYNSVLTTAQIAGLSSAGQWLFDEGSGTVANDTSDNLGAIDTGALASSPTWVTSGCHSNDCLNFSGSASVNIPYGAPLKFGTNPFTAVAWVNMTTAGTEEVVVGANRCGDAESWLLSVVNGKPSFGTWGTGAVNGYISSASAITAGAWHQLAAVRNGTSLTLLVDGVQVATGSVTAAWTSDSGASSMVVGSIGAGGCGSSGHEFIGDIDSVQMFSLALPTAMVQAL